MTKITYNNHFDVNEAGYTALLVRRLWFCPPPKKSCTDRRTHVRTDGNTDGQADGHPLIESWLTTKNNYEDGEGAQT